MDTGTDLAEIVDILSTRTYYLSIKVKVGLARDDKGTIRFIGGFAAATDQPLTKTTFLDYGTMILGEFGLSIPDFRKWILQVVKDDTGIFADFKAGMKGQFEYRGDLSQQMLPSNYQYFPTVWACNVFRYHLENTLVVQPPGFMPTKTDLPLYPDSRTALSDWLGNHPDRSDFNGTLATFLPNMEARFDELTLSPNRIGLSIVQGKSASDDLRCKVFVQEAFESMGKPQRSTNMELNFVNGKAEIEVDFKPGLIYAILVNDRDEVVDHQRLNATYPGAQAKEFEITVESLEKIIEQGEGDTLEFKAEVSKNRDELVETMVAFANSNGGIILLGVDDDGVIRGILDSEAQKMEEKLTNLSSEYCEPPVQFKTTGFVIHERNVVVVEIAKGGSRPYWLKNRGPMIRRGSTDRVMNRFEAEQAFRKPSLNPFEVTN